MLGQSRKSPLLINLALAKLMNNEISKIVAILRLDFWIIVDNLNQSEFHRWTRECKE